MFHEIEKEDSEKTAMTLAPENEFNNYGYQLLGAAEMDKAVDVPYFERIVVPIAQTHGIVSEKRMH